MSTVDERVAAGIALLDERTPDWRKKVDLDMLDLANGQWCVVGQVYGSFWDNQHKPFKYFRRADRLSRERRAHLEKLAEEHGFFIPLTVGSFYRGKSKYENLTKAWKRAIRKRDKAQR